MGRTTIQVAEFRELLRADVLEAARALLGWHIVRGDLRAEIVEVEAYRGHDDAGCHAFYGRTPRTEVMFGDPGFAYVYFTYGSHWMLNLTAHEPNNAAAILIRAARPIAGEAQMFLRRPKATKSEQLLSGPGKLAAAFDIDKRFYGIDLMSPNADLFFVPGTSPNRILSGPRIGLAIGKGDELPWRYVDADQLAWVSRPLKGLE